MIYHLNDDDVALATITDDRVEEPPERRQVLDVEVLKPVFGPQDARDSILRYYFAMKAICEQD